MPVTPDEPVGTATRADPAEATRAVADSSASLFPIAIAAAMLGTLSHLLIRGVK